MYKKIDKILSNICAILALLWIIGIVLFVLYTLYTAAWYAPILLIVGFVVFIRGLMTIADNW